VPVALHTAVVWVTNALVILAVAAVLAAGCGSTHSEVVLGKTKLTGRYGAGWGTSHPKLIYNGGVPSGKAWSLQMVGLGFQIGHCEGSHEALST
jgi:hypothetical protein